MDQADHIRMTHAWIQALRCQALDERYRRALVLSGAPDWASDQAERILAALPCLDWAWLGRHPSALPLEAAARLLGRDLDLLIYDTHRGFDPDGFGAASGALRAGGLLVLLTPPFADWPARTDPQAERLAVWPASADSVSGRYLERLTRILAADPHLISIQQENPVDPRRCLEQVSRHEYLRRQGAEHQAQTPHRGAVPQDTKSLDVFRRLLSEPSTPDQERAVAAILKTARGRARRPLVLTAHRGRGKSAALGLAAGRLLVAAEHRILVTAPRRASVEPIYRHARAVLADAAPDPEATTPDREMPRFLSPGELVTHRPPADLLLVDEAAAIPAPLLETMLRHYGRVVFATTVHGYEGTGRGFEIRFRATLDRLTPDWRALTLDTPIRWGPGDPLEALTFRALLLDAAPAVDEQVRSARPQDCEHARLDRDRLARDEPCLRELFGLLVLAHYQTRPMDLRMLLDGPNVSIHVLHHAGHIVATLLGAEEGGFTDPDLRQAIYEGRRRPRGHLLPQTLSAHAGLAEAPGHRYRRVIRIAVHPAAQGRGLGRRLLAAWEREALADGLDLVGASFGATPDLLTFWSRCGYRPVQIGTHRNAVSGEHAVVVLKAVSTAGGGFVERARDRLDWGLTTLLAGPLRDLDPWILTALTPLNRDGNPAPQGLSEAMQRELVAFVHGHRTLEASLPLLADLARWRLPGCLSARRLTPDDAALLIATARQLRPMAELVALFEASGRDEILRRLRRATEVLGDVRE